MIFLKSDEEIEIMKKSGSIVAQILQEIRTIVKPGVTTWELDMFAERRTKELGAIPAFKGYHDFPGTLCISVNDEVVHGIPSKTKILAEGDIVGVDFGVIYQEYYGDSAVTIPVGKISKEAQKLLEVTEKSLWDAISQCMPGKRLSDIGHAVQKTVETNGFSVVREFVGHGIGRSLHEDPQVPNYGPSGCGVELKPGMVIAIEPMVNMGNKEVKVLSDGWTAVTRDQSLSAHFEHTVAITSNGPRVLTKLD